MGFVKSDKGTQLALACSLTGSTPKEALQMSDVEQYMAAGLEMELLKLKFETLADMFDG